MKVLACLMLVLLVAGLAYGQMASPTDGGKGAVIGASRLPDAVPVGSCEGLTPGFWKNHLDAWPATGYAPSDSVGSAFGEVTTHFPALAGDSLLDALSYKGGPGEEGAARILLRAAVAALLNAAHPGLDFPDAPQSVISNTNNAIASEDRDEMLALAAYWDYENNLGGSF